MPAEELVVADTSPLLNLALIQRLDLLKSQFDRITAPRQVWEEITDGEAGVDAIRSLREDGFLTVTDVERSSLFIEIFHELDRGETAAICHAIEHNADLILLDERDGRQVARRHNLTITGAIGVLLRGQKEDEVVLEDELDALREAGFWISDELYATVLSEATE